MVAEGAGWIAGAGGFTFATGGWWWHPASRIESVATRNIEQIGLSINSLLKDNCRHAEHGRMVGWFERRQKLLREELNQQRIMRESNIYRQTPSPDSIGKSLRQIRAFASPSSLAQTLTPHRMIAKIRARTALRARNAVLGPCVA